MMFELVLDALLAHRRDTGGNPGDHDHRTPNLPYPYD